MASRYVALLRGINVGRAKRVPMADLRAVLEGLGYSDVRTLLNSGNAVFTAPAVLEGDPGGRISKALADRVGVSSRVTVLTAAELAAVVREFPFDGIATDPTRTLVAFLADAADRTRLMPLLKGDWGPDRLAIGTRVAYIWCSEGILASRALEGLARELGEGVTTRNYATVAKLDRLASGN